MIPSHDLIALSLQTRPRRPVSLRAVLLGLAGVFLICAFTPYNDYALNNTFLVGNNLPLGAIMLLFVFSLFINAPLSRFTPRFAFSAGEITVAFSMTLVSCALPSSGLMRYLPPSLVIPFYHARANAEFRELFNSFGLPTWLFPTMKGNSIEEWMNDPIVTDYFGRWTGEGPVPYSAWIVPAISWGIFIFALYGALLFMVTLIRRQWYENERLPFPLAQIQLALIETPPPRRFFNSLFSTPSFWIAFGLVFCLHLWNGMERYYPEYFTRIPVSYNLWDLFRDPPWNYLDYKIKDAAVFFTAVGVTYFLSSSVAFSLWAFYILHNLYRVWLGVTTGDPTVLGMADQNFGGVIAFFLSVLWIGRKHWQLILRQAFRGQRPDEPHGRYLSYPFAFWGFIACCLIMVAWLIAAGCTVPGAVVLVSMLLILFFIIMRFVAEVGLLHGQMTIPLYKPWVLYSIAAHAQAIPTKTFYLSALLQSHHFDFREVVPVYASHGLKLADKTIFSDHSLKADTTTDRSTGRRFISALALALFVGYIVSFSSTLWTEYAYGVTKDITQTAPINSWGADGNPYAQVILATNSYNNLNYHPAHNSATHIAFGFIFTALLAFLRLQFTWWPLHPIGFLMIGTFPGAHLWLSIFLGWLLKVLIVRFGGADLFVRAKPFFIGLIAGESLAAAFWLVLGILLNAVNIPYRVINIMPG